MIKLNILNMNGFLQIVNQCSGAVNAIFPDGKRRDLNKSYAAQKVLWDQFRENQGSLALKLDFQKPEDYISIVYYYISEILSAEPGRENDKKPAGTGWFFICSQNTA